MEKRASNSIVPSSNERQLDSQTILNKIGLLQKPFLHILLITILGLLAYSNTFHVPFQFDDEPYIVKTPIITSFNYFIEPSKARVFNNNLAGYNTLKMRYIGYLTFALNYKIYGLDVTGYHVVNLIIHILNAILVYWLAVLTFKTPYFKVSVVSASVGKTVSVTSDSDSKKKLTLRTDTDTVHYSLIALFSALLFVSHPIQTQAVTYIWQRVASLATLFYLLSFVLYIKWRQDKKCRVECVGNSNGQILSYTLSPTPYSIAKRYLLYAASLLSAVLAMKTKELAFTLPIIITLYEFMFFEGKMKKRFFSIIPFLLTMLIIPLTLIGTNKPITDVISTVLEANKIPEAIPTWDYLLTQFRVIVTYIRLLFLPVNQNLDYDYPIYTSFFNPNVYLSFLFLLGIFVFAVYLFYATRVTYHSIFGITPPSPPLNLRGGRMGLKGGMGGFDADSLIHPFTYFRLIAFGIFWFFITLSIESTIIPISPSLLLMFPIRTDIDVIFEHRVYLPSVGIFIAVSISIFIIADKLKNRWQIANKIVISMLIVIICALLIATYARNTVWQNEVSLWEDVVRKSPEKARGHYGLGAVYSDKEWVDKAIEHYQIALRLKPNYVEAYYNLGNAYNAKGLIDKAIEHYQIALRLKPDHVEAHNNLGNAYNAKGLIDKAIEHYQIALKLKPDYVEAHYNLGLFYLEKGFIDEACREFETVLLINPNAQQARQFLSYLSNLKSKQK